MLSMVLMEFPSLGKVSGVLRPSKRVSFVWIAAWGKILSNDNLIKRGLFSLLVLYV